jgi:hyaluronan synthase
MVIKRPVGFLVILLSFSIYAAFLFVINNHETNVVVRTLWIFSYALHLLGMVVFVFHRKPRTFPLPKGKTVCVVPAYNEKPEVLSDCVRSLLSQSVDIDLIYIVDDCSKTPVDLPEFETHGNIRIIRQDKNRGKRQAQAAALYNLDTSEYPFLLTVDSDSVLAPNALECMLRQMSDYKVKACTGSIMALNSNTNLLTKIQEMNYGVSIAVTRSPAKVLGFLDTTSGACALYRTEIICFHMNDYLTHGERYPAGDDRRMAIYSMMEGSVAYVAEAVAYTEVPETLRKLCKQRLRWAIGAWSAFPYCVVNLGYRKSLFQLQKILFSILLPPFLGLTLYYSLQYPFAPLLFYESILFILLTSYTNALLYVFSRPLNPDNIRYSMKYIHLKTPGTFRLVVERFFDWLIVTPMLVLFVHTLSALIKYIGLARVLLHRQKGWGTR